MESYSQTKEDLKVNRFFRNQKGTLLSVGENDGTTFSNAKLLIENGWKAYLLEPASVYSTLAKLYEDNNNVETFNFGIGAKTEKVKFWESANHVKGGSDKALVSSTKYEETERWRKAGVEFEEKEILLKSFHDFYMEEGKPIFDFITIDAEGHDWEILKQIDLREVGCKCLCIEWNGNPKLEANYRNYCAKYGLKEFYRNGENILYGFQNTI